MPELHEALDEALAPDRTLGDHHSDEAREKWRIDGERTADWALRRLARGRDHMDRVRRLANEEHAAIDEWVARELERDERDERFFVGKLREWMEELRANGDDRKTISYPGGKLRRKAGRTRVEIDDEAALLAWLEEHVDDLEAVVEYRSTIRKGEVGKRYKSKVRDDVPGDYPCVDPDSMEILPGVRIVRPESTFDVETNSAPGSEERESQTEADAETSPAD